MINYSLLVMKLNPRVSWFLGDSLQFMTRRKLERLTPFSGQLKKLPRIVYLGLDITAVYTHINFRRSTSTRVREIHYTEKIINGIYLLYYTVTQTKICFGLCEQKNKSTSYLTPGLLTIRNNSFRPLQLTSSLNCLGVIRSYSSVPI